MGELVEVLGFEVVVFAFSAPVVEALLDLGVLPGLGGQLGEGLALVELAEGVDGLEKGLEQAGIDGWLVAHDLLDAVIVDVGAGGEDGGRVVKGVDGPLDDVLEVDALHGAVEALALDLVVDDGVVGAVEGEPVADVVDDLADAAAGDSAVVGDVEMGAAVDLGELEDFEIAVGGRGEFRRTVSVVLGVLVMDRSPVKGV